MQSISAYPIIDRVTTTFISIRNQFAYTGLSSLHRQCQILPGFNANIDTCAYGTFIEDSLRFKLNKLLVELTLPFP